MSRAVAIVAAAALAASACSSGTAERAARDGARNGLIGAALGAVAGAVSRGGSAGRGALTGAAVGATSGVVTAVVDDLIYGPGDDDGYATGRSGGHVIGESPPPPGGYDWGPYPYDPVRAEQILAEDRYSPDALGRPVPYPYDGAGTGAAGPAGVIVAERSSRPRDVAGGAYYLTE